MNKYKSNIHISEKKVSIPYQLLTVGNIQKLKKWYDHKKDQYYLGVGCITAYGIHMLSQGYGKFIGLEITESFLTDFWNFSVLKSVNRKPYERSICYRRLITINDYDIEIRILNYNNNHWFVSTTENSYMNVKYIHEIQNILKLSYNLNIDSHGKTSFF